jgi:cholesterol transport system auxiliary component
LVDHRSLRVLATQTFEAYENAPSDSPYGGVIAANRALKQLLGQIANFTNYHGSIEGVTELRK